MFDSSIENTLFGIYYIDVLENLKSIEIPKLTVNIENDFSHKTKEAEKELPEIELTTQKEQIRLLYDLGVIEFLQDKFKATLENNSNQTAKLLSQILKLQQTSISPTISSLLNNNVNKNYPKETQKTKLIIDTLNANEQS